MSFQKPGSRSKAAFGIAFDSAVKPSDGAGAHQAPSQRGRQEQQPHPVTSRNQQQHLPAWAHRRQVLYLVENHAVVILLGDTGSGKTTQVPQFLLDAGWAAGGRMIAVTQPRRAAAVTVAARVAEERGEKLGEGSVGYAVRFDSVATQGVTQLKFVTDGVLIREMMEDPLLTNYSVVMVDEVHERSLATDMLLGLLRKVQNRRPDLRLIVSSATLDVDPLVRFFRHLGPSTTSQPPSGAPKSRDPAIISIQGRTHPVEVHYLQQPCSDYVRATVEAVVEIHKVDLPGDVLVFLTGQQEVEAAVRLLDEEAQKLALSSGYGLKMLPLPLYAGLPSHAQQAALAPAARGWRKVVVATNIAETSLTLEGVVYVVDSCFVKQRAYNPLLGLEALCVAPESKASAAQRAGRAGRVHAGKVFRLCTQETFQKELPDVSVPEMQRSDLTGMVLQLKSLGIDNVLKFHWLSPPPAEALVRALEGLSALGVLDDDGRLTSEVGMRMAALPLDPPLGRALLASFNPARSCSQELLTIAACLSAAPQGVWLSTAAAGGPRALDEAKRRFSAAEGDLVTLLNVWKGWQDNGRSKSWCARHCLHHPSLLKASEIRGALEGACRRMGLPAPESCDGDMDHLRRALVAGYFMNAASYERTDYNPLAPESDPGTAVYRLVRPVGGSHATFGTSVRGGGAGSSTVSGAVDTSRLRLRVHPQSVLFRCQPAWVVFTTVQQSDSGWYEMQGVTAIEREYLLQEAAHYYASAR